MAFVAIILFTNSIKACINENVHFNIRKCQIVLTFVMILNYAFFIINSIMRLNSSIFRFFKTTIFVCNLIGAVAAFITALLELICLFAK